jgi:hypothetical protein
MDGIQRQRVMRAERYQLEDLTLDPELQPREAIDHDLLPSMSDDTPRVATADLKLVLRNTEKSATRDSQKAALEAAERLEARLIGLEQRLRRWQPVSRCGGAEYAPDRAIDRRLQLPD